MCSEESGCGAYFFESIEDGDYSWGREVVWVMFQLMCLDLYGVLQGGKPRLEIFQDGLDGG
jgi:hypothetical protein